MPPWEKKYQAPVQSGPWTKYSEPAAKSSPSLSDITKDILASTDWAGLRRIGYGVAPAIAPMIGAVGMTPMLGPVGGAVTGGVMGEAFNNAIGLTQPSVQGYASQALIPPALKGVASLKRLGGAFGEKAGAETLNRLASPEIRNILQQYKPPVPSKLLFEKVGNGMIPMPHAREAAQEITTRIARQLPSEQPLYKNSGNSARDILALFEKRKRGTLTPEEERVLAPYAPSVRYNAEQLRDPLADMLAQKQAGVYRSTGEQIINPPVVDKSLQSAQDIALGKLPQVKRFFPDLPTQGQIAGATVFPKQIIPGSSSQGAPEQTAAWLQEYLDQSLPNKLKSEAASWEPGPGGLPAQRFQEAMRTAGERVRAAQRGEQTVGGSANVGNFKTLYGGYAKDLEAAPTLKEARQAFKRERVLEDIEDLARPFTMSGQGDVERFRANKIINRLKDPEDDLAKFYRQSFSPEEQASLMKSLVNLNKIPPISAPRGTDAGSKERLGQIAGIIGMGGAGGAIGHAGAMGAEGAGIGAAAGYLIPKIHTMVTNYNIANNTTTGKALIKELWHGSGGKFSPQFWSALEAFAASQAANPNAELFTMVGRP